MYCRRGYVTQIVYVCDTCIDKLKERLGEADPSVVHGMCMQCANHCHGVLGHSIRNIGRLQGHIISIERGPKNVWKSSLVHFRFDVLIKKFRDLSFFYRTFFFCLFATI